MALATGAGILLADASGSAPHAGWLAVGLVAGASGTAFMRRPMHRREAGGWALLLLLAAAAGAGRLAVARVAPAPDAVAALPLPMEDAVLEGVVA